MNQEAISDQVAQRVLDAVNHDELIELTSDLVRINSVWDPVAGTSEQAAAEHIASWARNRGFDVNMDRVAPGRPNVIVNMDLDTGDRRLMFEGHTDVVTPGDVTAWNHHPFGAEIVGDRMYGRGTNDTKGNLAAMLVAMHALKKSGVRLNGSMVGGVLCDEEDQMLGVLDFIKRGRADGITGAVICEPQDGMICTSQKGALRARFSIQGRMSHGALPLSGMNTAPAVARLIDGLHRLEMEAVAHQGCDPHLGWPSFTPTVVQAPSAGPPQLNVMPGEAHVLVDIRTVPWQSHEDIQSTLRAMASEVEQQVADHYAAYDQILSRGRDHRIKLDVAYLTDRPCTLTADNDPLVQAADWATRRVTSEEPVYGGVLGATDGTFLWAMKDIPIVTMGAGERQVAHQVDEWVNLDQLRHTAETYALTALKYLIPET